MSHSQANIDKDNIDDSESIASDESEEIIEVDEDEYERRRATILSDMKELELLFCKLKEALISEKQILIDQKLKEIEDETAEEFTQPLLKLKHNMEVKINLATLLKDYKCKNIEHIYQYEETSVKKTLENNKQTVYDKYKTKLEDDIKDLEEKRRQFLLDYNIYQLSVNGSFDEHENMNVDAGEVDCAEAGEAGMSVLNETNEDTFSEEIKKVKKSKKSSPKSTLSPGQINHNHQNNNHFSSILLHGSPYIVYSLQDYDILEDWSIIKMNTNLNSNLNSKIASTS